MSVAKCVLVFVFAVLLCTTSWAQSVENSKVTGVVTDPSDAPVAGAQVQMTQTGTGLVRTVMTNGDGSYTIPDLPTGDYQLQVKKEGFNTYVQSGIVLQVGSNPTLNAALQVGTVTQAVTVTANAAIVETHSSSIGEVVNHQEILDIPLNARDPMQLLTLTPSAVVAADTIRHWTSRIPTRLHSRAQVPVSAPTSWTAAMITTRIHPTLTRCRFRTPCRNSALF